MEIVLRGQDLTTIRNMFGINNYTNRLLMSGYPMLILFISVLLCEMYILF